MFYTYIKNAYFTQLQYKNLVLQPEDVQENKERAWSSGVFPLCQVWNLTAGTVDDKSSHIFTVIFAQQYKDGLPWYFLP